MTTVKQIKSKQKENEQKIYHINKSNFTVNLKPLANQNSR